MFLTTLCVQSFPFALLKGPYLGTTRWGRKIKKNPGNNKNNADRQRFQGGFVKTDPPFDFLACKKPENPASHPFPPSFFDCIAAKHVHLLRKPLKSPFLRFANTEFHA